jgi:hypothetical protein
MRKETLQLLAKLSASNSKRTLMGLWTDLRSLSKDEFESAIMGSSAKAPKRIRQVHTAPVVSDRPAPRIAHLMLQKCAMTAPDAVEALRQQLAKQRISNGRIPAMQGTDFEAWLTILFKTVPSSKVLHAAIELSDRAEAKP